MALPLSYNVRNVIVRWQVTLLALAGIALVVAVLIALTAMANGFRMALRATGSADNAIVTQRGSAIGADLGLRRDNASIDPRRLARGARRAGPPAGLAGDDRRRRLPKRGDGTGGQRHRARRLADGVRGAAEREDRRGPHSSRPACTS